MTKIIIGRSSDHKLALALSERLHRRTKFAPTFRVSALRLSGSGRLELNTKPFRDLPARLRAFRHAVLETAWTIEHYPMVIVRHQRFCPS